MMVLFLPVPGGLCNVELSLDFSVSMARSYPCIAVRLDPATAATAFRCDGSRVALICANLGPTESHSGPLLADGEICPRIH